MLFFADFISLVGRNSSPMKAGASTLSTVPASISSEMWVVDLNSKKRYLALFNRLDNRRTGSVHGQLLIPLVLFNLNYEYKMYVCKSMLSSL